MKNKLRDLKIHVDKMALYTSDVDDIKLLQKGLTEIYKEVIEKEDYDFGDFGIEYYTIHDDSRYWDKDTLFFHTREERDKVFEDWSKNLYWDNDFDTELQYRTPSPNYNHDKSKKIKKVRTTVETIEDDK